MHFMDPFNFDTDRVKDCVIHYAVPDGRVIPFCTMNSIYRQGIEDEFSIPLNQKMTEFNDKTGEEVIHKLEKEGISAYIFECDWQEISFTAYDENGNVIEK